MSHPASSARPELDIQEKGAPRDGRPQTLDRRLFVQLLAFGGCPDAAPVAALLRDEGVEGALYEDALDPFGVAIAAVSEDPAFFLTRLRRILQRDLFKRLEPKPALTMFGRTYGLGFESNLEDWLLRKPRRTMLNPEWPWAVWYPLRRSGAFFQLEPKEQSKILGEHAAVGRAFGEADFSHDVRLACFGIDREDNDFVIGLVGKDLHPLSATVQAMRRTQQTSLYIQRMGPFFVGRAAWQSPPPAGPQAP